MLTKIGGRVSFRFIRVYWLNLDVSNLYQFEGKVQSYNKMNANTLLSVIIWKYGQKYYDIPKSRHLYIEICEKPYFIH